MLNYILLLLLAVTDFTYTAEQAVFLKADTAKVRQVEDGVTIQVTNLDPKSSAGIVLSLQGAQSEIVVTQLLEFNGITVGVYPPVRMTPDEQGTYQIIGSPGDRYGVQVSKLDGAITHLYLEIDGAPDLPPTDPIPSPPVNLKEVTRISKEGALALSDPITKNEILKELELIEVFSFEAIRQAIDNGLINSMPKLNPPYKDWKGKFRKPLNDYISSSNVTDAEAVAKAIVAGLKDTASVTKTSSKIQMFTLHTCDICDRWKREVWPAFRDQGWQLEIITSLNGPVPRFVVCDNNKCSQEFSGYMDIVTLTNVIAKMRGSP